MIETKKNAVSGTIKFEDIDMEQSREGRRDVFYSVLLPQNQLEKNVWARHFYKNNSLVATAIDLHAERSLSNIKLSLPKEMDNEKNRAILKYFVRMMGNQGCGLFNKLLQISTEYNKLGNVFAWVQLSKNHKWCESVTLLDPDYVIMEKLGRVNKMTAELVPDDNIRSIVEGGQYHPKTGSLYRALSPDTCDAVAAQMNVVLNTDPWLGSHVAHLARKMSDFDKWGVSLIERCFKNLVYKDRLLESGDLGAIQHMMPNINDEILIGLHMPELRVQADAAGSGRTMFAIREQQYAKFRTTIEDFVYRSIFIPVCEACGFYEIDYDDSGEIKNYLYPQICWGELDIDDVQRPAETGVNLGDMSLPKCAHATCDGGVLIDTSGQVMSETRVARRFPNANEPCELSLQDEESGQPTSPRRHRARLFVYPLLILRMLSGLLAKTCGWRKRKAKMTTFKVGAR